MCDIRGAQFNEAGLGMARLRMADISGCECGGAYIYGARARGAKADHADFSRVRGAHAEIMPGGPDTEMAEARRHVTIDDAGNVRMKPGLTSGRAPIFGQEEIDFLRRERVAMILQAGEPRTAACMTDLRVYDFSGLDLSGLDMSNCDLSGANFHRVDMRRTKLTDSVLASAEFVSTDLSEAEIRNCYIVGTVICGCRATGSVFDGSIIRDTSVKPLNRDSERRWRETGAWPPAQPEPAEAAPRM